jgi:hypothetical protein
MKRKRLKLTTKIKLLFVKAKYTDKSEPVYHKFKILDGEIYVLKRYVDKKRAITWNEWKI